MKRFSLNLTTIAIAIATVALADVAAAQLVGFNAHGRDAIYTPDDFQTSGFGNATHMGNVFGAGTAFPSNDLGGGLFEWTATDYSLTDRNGDQIFMDGGGLVQFIPISGNTFFAIWTGEFNVLYGTGRYENVGPGPQPLQVTAINNPFELDGNGDPIPGDTWTYDWRLKGKFEWGRRGGGGGK